MTIGLRDYPITMPGSKRQVIERIYPLLPKLKGDFIVPFFGTGVDSYFLIEHDHRVVAGEELGVLVSMHNDFVRVHEHAQGWIASRWNAEIYKSAYNDLRVVYNNKIVDEHTISWIFYLLTRTSFNGLVRHNKAGGFNAPVGTFKANPVCSVERAAKHAEFINSLVGQRVFCRDYSSYRGTSSDVRYYDPPYLGTFNGYSGKPFDHDRFFAHLADDCKRGLPWGCSNSPAARLKFEELGATVYDLDRRDLMSMNPKTRKSDKAGEILAVWTP